MKRSNGGIHISPPVPAINNTICSPQSASHEPAQRRAQNHASSPKLYIPYHTHPTNIAIGTAGTYTASASQAVRSMGGPGQGWLKKSHMPTNGRATPAASPKTAAGCHIPRVHLQIVESTSLCTVCPFLCRPSIRCTFYALLSS